MTDKPEIVHGANLHGQWHEKRPERCRERLKENNEPYGKSNCEVCGSVLFKKCPYEED